MKPTEFLALIGAPWSAYHDHPDPETAKDRAAIRSTDVGDYCNEICGIYLCNYPGKTGEQQRARRDLITQAPRMYEYVASMAATGDTEAKLILRAIHGGAE